MNKFRDLLYDKNDLVVALIIILVAALVIMWRVNAIMDFPKTIIAAEQAGEEDSLPTKYSATKDTGDANDGIRTPGSVASDDDGDEDSDTGEKLSGYSIYINYGDSVSTVAGYLVDLEFFETKEECIAAINDAGLAQRLQVGTHIIPRDATPEEAIKALTTSPGM